MARRHTIRAVMIIIGIILLAVLIVLLFNRPSTSNTKKTTTMPDTSNTTPKSPDQVKSNSGPNGDTTPSPSGTNPNGNNSLLSQ